MDKGLLNMALQHAQMALFCTEYLHSAPFHGLTQDEKFKEHTLNGYYALQDYAVPNWLSHIKSSLETPGEISDCICKALIHQVGLIFDEYGKSERHEFRLCDRESRNVAEIVRCIPRDVGAWTQWFDLEWRTSCIRNSMETLRDDWASDASKGRVMEQIYGPRLFKCSRIECAHFMGGFEARHSRDKHLDRHNRPFICVEAHCPLQVLGFETEEQLKVHIKRNHIRDDADRFVFPTLARRKDDDIYKASTRGDVAALKGFLEARADVNSTSRPKGGETPLLLAARNSHLDICKMLLEGGANVNFRGPSASNESTALHAAVSCEDVEIVQHLLSVKGVLTNQKNKDGQTPLHLAVEKNSNVIVELLLATGNVDESIEDIRGQTPFMIATINQREKLITLLLATGNFDPNTRDRQGSTPLSRAAAAGAETVVRLLLGTGKIDPDTRDMQGWTPLSRAAAAGSETVVRLLLATGRVSIDNKDEHGFTSLSRAVQSGSERVVRLLLSSNKFDVEAKDSCGRTLLLIAVEHNRELLVKFLLTTVGVNPDAEDDNRRSALGIAAALGEETLVKLLLATGRVNPDAKDEDGRTPLSVAAATGREAVVKLLLETEGVDPNTRDKYSLTPISRVVQQLQGPQINFRPSPNGGSFAFQDYQMQLMLLEQENKKRLMMARQEQDSMMRVQDPMRQEQDSIRPLLQVRSVGSTHEMAERIIKLLLATGDVAPDTRDNAGRTPLSITAEIGAEQIVELLLATNEVDPNTRDNTGRTPLNWAAEKGWEAVIALLLATRGIDPDAEDDDGRTPLSRAVEKGETSVVQMLLATGKVNPEATDNSGRSPLSLATEQARCLRSPELPHVKEQMQITALNDYQKQIMLPEQQKKKRLMIARPGQDSTGLPTYQSPPRRFSESTAILGLLLDFARVDPNATDNAKSSQRSVVKEVDELTNQSLMRTGQTQTGTEHSNDASNDHHKQLAIIRKPSNERKC
jgi:ankyrin repeat protein